MKTIQRIHDKLPTFREIMRIGSSLLMVLGQRLPFLKPCASLFLETNAARSFVQLAVPVGVAYVGTHSLSGASIAVTTAAGSTNPANATVGSNFQWFCQSSGSHDFRSYTVTGLPAGLVFTFGRPISSITGTPRVPGAYTVSLTGWEYSGQSGIKTKVYNLALNVAAGGTAKPEIVVEQPTGTSLVDGTAKKSFGTVVVGMTGTAKTFKIKNTGTANLTGLAITKDGTHPGSFIVTAPGKTSLAPGTSTTFKVSFKPAGATTRNATIHIKNNDANENPFDIKLTGMGAP